MTPEKCQEKAEQETPSQVIEIEGIGTIEVYGEWNAEALIKRLLKSKAITG